jgi:hypothetical protein
MALPIIVEGVASHAVWHSLTATWGRLSGNTIRITSPSPRETLKNPERLDNGMIVYAVRGALKRLPADHRIWLLTQDEVNGWVHPHFRPADYYKDTGEWERRINSTHQRAKIIAVAAPPTSHDFFCCYQEQCGKTGNAPLARVPLECKNRAEVIVDLQP